MDNYYYSISGGGFSEGKSTEFSGFCGELWTNSWCSITSSSKQLCNGFWILVSNDNDYLDTAPAPGDTKRYVRRNVVEILTGAPPSLVG